MEFKDLLLDGKVIGKYIEVDMTKYDLKLISRKMHDNKYKKVRDYINLTEKAEAGINGCLFDWLTHDLVGFAKDSSGLVDGQEDAHGPHIAWDNNKLNQNWNAPNTITASWVLSPAYYWFLRDGQYVSQDAMTGYDGYIEKSKTRSMIGQKADGTIVLAATTESVTGEQQAKAFQAIGCSMGANLDGGDSRQLVIKSENTSPIEKNREVPNAIIVVKKDEKPIDPPPTGKCTMKLFGSAAYLRDAVVTGTVKITIPNGTEFEVVGLYSWKAPDGYRWGYGKYGESEGFFQYDPAVMMPQGRYLDTLNYKMRLAGSAARIRTYPVGGEVLTVVPDGSDITLIEFGKIIESDGYQWFQGKFNGITGFLQYDPAVMFPTND